MLFAGLRVHRRPTLVSGDSGEARRGGASCGYSTPMTFSSNALSSCPTGSASPRPLRSWTAITFLAGMHLRPFRGRSGNQKILAPAGTRRETIVMNKRELEERVDEILLKQARGEKLTKREETILAYTYYAARHRTAPMRIRVRREP